MKFSDFEAVPPFPDKTNAALTTIGLSLSDKLNWTRVKEHTETLVKTHGGGDGPSFEEIKAARFQVLVFLRSAFHVKKIRILSKRYSRRAEVIKIIIDALKKSVIKHREARELYETLARISIWIDRQETVFLKSWESLPEATIGDLKVKANIIENEEENIAFSSEMLRRMCRCCKLRGYNTIIPAHPHPNEALLAWFEDFQNKCGWVEIPAPLHVKHTAPNGA